MCQASRYGYSTDCNLVPSDFSLAWRRGAREKALGTRLRRLGSSFVQNTIGTIFYRQHIILTNLGQIGLKNRSVVVLVNL